MAASIFGNTSRLASPFIVECGMTRLRRCSEMRRIAVHLAVGLQFRSHLLSPAGLPCASSRHCRNRGCRNWNAKPALRAAWMPKRRIASAARRHFGDFFRRRARLHIGVGEEGRAALRDQQRERREIEHSLVLADDLRNIAQMPLKAAFDAAYQASASPRLSASAAITVVLVRTMVRAASGITPLRPTSAKIRRHNHCSADRPAD